MDAYVATALKTFDVPGIAVAIVKDGKVVLAKGYGVRKMASPHRSTRTPRLPSGLTPKPSRLRLWPRWWTKASSLGTIRFTSGCPAL
jgi:CubicO group peptidase (beta-lactamase class C family)